MILKGSYAHTQCHTQQQGVWFVHILNIHHDNHSAHGSRCALYKAPWGRFPANPKDFNVIIY